MAWTIEFDPGAQRELARLDQSVQRDIKRYLTTRVAQAENPRQYGKGLTQNRSGLWRYRVHDYRIICNLLDDRLIVLVVAVGHRGVIYER